MSASRIEEMEKELIQLKERIAAAKRAEPRKPVGDYVFQERDGTRVALTELFGTNNDLIWVHNMGTDCPYCTLWADGFSGMQKHLENRAAFVVASPDPPEVQAEFHDGRGWTFRMVSTHGTTFNKDMGFEGADGDPWPGVTTFHRQDDGSIVRVASAPFGPGDDFCIVWPFLDLLADGPAGWEPRYTY